MKIEICLNVVFFIYKTKGPIAKLAVLVRLTLPPPLPHPTALFSLYSGRFFGLGGSAESVEVDESATYILAWELD